VDKPGNNFLSRSAFSQEENWNINIRYQRRLGSDLPHRRTGGYEEHVVTKLFHLANVVLLIDAKALIDDGVEFGLLKGLGQIIMRAQTNRLHDFAGVADAGKHHDFHSGPHLAQLLERLQAINPGHQQVQQHQVGLQALLHTLQSFFTRARSLNFVIVHFKQSADIPQHSRFIIDQ